jgi:hypothetical protein
LSRREVSGTVLCAAVVCRRKNTLGLVEAVTKVRSLGIDVRLRLAGAIVGDDERTGPGDGQQRFHPHAVALRTREVYRKALARSGPPPRPSDSTECYKV